MDSPGTWGWANGYFGHECYIELRKYIDMAREPEGDQVYMVNHEGEYRYSVKGQVGYPFFW